MTNATFSRELEFGSTPSAELGGLTIAQFGLALAPANLSARQAEALGLLTSGICGPRGSTSLRSVALQESLANKLRAMTGSGGSILYRLTWKTRVTPSGRSICALRGSPNKAATVADLICGSASISPQFLRGWTTPQAHDVRKRGPGNRNNPAAGNADLNWDALATGWSTLVTNDAEKRGAVDPFRGNGLSGQAPLSGWPTPRTVTGGAESGERKRELGRTGSGGSDPQAVALMAGWPTASARDWRDSGGMAETATNPDGSHRDRTDQLPRKAMVAGWPTPNATAFHVLAPDGPQIWSLVATGNGVQLNPELSRWLMRFPREWGQCAPGYGSYATLQVLVANS